MDNMSASVPTSSILAYNVKMESMQIFYFLEGLVMHSY